MKKTLSITLLFAAILLGCKKNKNQLPEYDVNGSWIILYTKVNTQTYQASQYPCMLNSHLVIRPNGVAMFKWDDTEMCWLNDAHTISFNQPGPDSTAVTYVRSGNTIRITYPQGIHPEYGQITLTGNKLQLSLTDTSNYNNAGIITQATYTKE